MNAVKLFNDIIKCPERIEIVNSLEDFMMTGNISIKIKDLADEEKEELSHLRISNINGVIFDDREKELWQAQELEEYNG